MVSSNGGAYPQECLPKQQQQRQSLNTILQTVNFPPRLKYRPSVALPRKHDVIRFIVRRASSVGLYVKRNRDSLRNLSALGVTLVRAALQAAYRSSRIAIFTPSSGAGTECFATCAEDDGEGSSSAMDDTIAGGVLSGLAEFAEPSLFMGILSAFLAYGIDFQKARREALCPCQEKPEWMDANGTLLLECLNSCLPPLDNALWCLHGVANKILLLAAGKISKFRQLPVVDGNVDGLLGTPCPVTGEERSGCSAPSEAESIYLLLQRAYSILALLHVFALNEVLSADGTPFSLKGDNGTGQYTMGSLCSLLTTSPCGTLPSVTALIKDAFEDLISPMKRLIDDFEIGCEVDIEGLWDYIHKLNRTGKPWLVFALACFCAFSFIQQQCVPQSMTAQELSMVTEFLGPRIFALYGKCAGKMPVGRDGFAGGAGFGSGSFPVACGSSRGTMEHNARGPTAATQVDTSCISLPHCEPSEGPQSDSFNHEVSATATLAKYCVSHKCIGLLNAGNTCFMNSLLQVLFAAKRFSVELEHYVLKGMFKKMVPNVQMGNKNGFNLLQIVAGEIEKQLCDNDRVVAAAAFITAEMRWRLHNNQTSSPVSTENLKHFAPPPFNNGRQHDASEFAMMLMDRIDSFVAPKHIDDTVVGEEQFDNAQDRKNGSGPYLLPTESGAEHSSGKPIEEKPAMLVTKWFGGTLVSTVKCQRCYISRSQRTPFWNITVPLRHDGNVVSTSESLMDAQSAGHDQTAPQHTEATCAADECIIAGTHHTDTTRKQNSVNGSNSFPYEGKDEGAIGSKLTQRPSLQSLLNKVLNRSESAELLQGDNMIFCETCCSQEPAVLSHAVHGTRVPTSGFTSWDGIGGCNEGELHETVGEDSIRDVPHYLMLQLNRFQYSSSTGSHEKVMDAVRVDRRISVPVRVAKQTQRSPPARKRDEDTIKGVLAKACPEGCNGEDGVEEQELADGVVQYKLKAVLVHSGPSVFSGHYFSLLCIPSDAAAEANVRAKGVEKAECEEEDFWVLANDSHISAINDDTLSGLLSGSGGVFGRFETPYIILYERCQGPVVASRTARSLCSSTADNGGHDSGCADQLFQLLLGAHGQAADALAQQ